ncbi:hypothetical protein KCU81_g9948, partial [Aureobasidium melanogenum]|uniref:Uncharacterized protein n=2 Tax=Aureobasidium melanogenum TaxID=46634 RepID=A0A074VFA6_AURM1
MPWDGNEHRFSRPWWLLYGSGKRLGRPRGRDGWDERPGSFLARVLSSEPLYCTNPKTLGMLSCSVHYSGTSRTPRIHDCGAQKPLTALSRRLTSPFDSIHARRLRDPWHVDCVYGSKEIVKLVSAHDWGELGGLLVLDIYSRDSVANVAHDVFQEAQIGILFKKASLCFEEIRVEFPLLDSAHDHRR